MTEDIEADRRYSIIASARETLHRIRNIEVDHRDVSEPDAMESWRCAMPPRPASAPPLTTAEVDERIAAALANIDGRIAAGIAAALAEQRQLANARMAAVGEALGAIRSQLRAEIAAEVGQLRADLTVEKAHAEPGRIIDLPAVLPLRGARHG